MLTHIIYFSSFMWKQQADFSMSNYYFKLLSSRICFTFEANALLWNLLHVISTQFSPLKRSKDIICILPIGSYIRTQGAPHKSLSITCIWDKSVTSALNLTSGKIRLSLFCMKTENCYNKKYIVHDDYDNRMIHCNQI